jgi:uncharacterized protein
MKIVIPGGSGQVGALLARHFHAKGHEVVVLSRQPAVRPWRVTRWDGRHPGDWTKEIDGCDAVINLAGRSVNCRYTPENKKQIIESRVLSTRAVGESIHRATHPPRLWLQASTATIYAHRYDAPNDEATGRLGGNEPDAPQKWRFSIDVAKAWEQELCIVAGRLPETRTVLMRSAVTMSPDSGGIFDTLLRLVRRGLGGTAGDGRQYVSWIHEDDFVRAVQWLIDRDDLSGVVNLASPNPLPNAEFMLILRDAANVRIGLPASRWMLEVGALMMQTESELVLKSRCVVPARLLDHGFEFRWPLWADAARDLCERARRR